MTKLLIVSFILSVVFFSSSSSTTLAQLQPLVPEDLEECIAVLKKTLSVEELKKLRNGPETIVGEMQSTVGLGIRNSWLRGNEKASLVKSFGDLGITNFNDMSDIILISLWRDLHSRPIKLKEQVRVHLMASKYTFPETRDKMTVPPNVWNMPLKLSNGKRTSLSKLNAKVVAITFVYSDDHSARAISMLNGLQKKLGTKNFQAIAVPHLLSEQEVKSLIARDHPQFPVVSVHSDLNQLLRDTVVPGDLLVPTTIVIGRDRSVRTRLNDFTEWGKTSVSLERAACANGGR